MLPYLTRAAAEGTFRALGTLPAGSGVAFDYGITRSALNDAQQIAQDWLAARVARVGEPFRLGFEPDALRELLLGCGFSRLEDLNSAEIVERYFADRRDGFTVRGSGHIACAWRD